MQPFPGRTNPHRKTPTTQSKTTPGQLSPFHNRTKTHWTKEVAGSLQFAFFVRFWMLPW
jgi:hypothetical protein